MVDRVRCAACCALFLALLAHSSVEAVGLQPCTPGECPDGACRFEDCADPVSCDGGACIFINCTRPACNGGACIFDHCGQPSCNGGACSFIGVDWRGDGICEGGACSFDNSPPLEVTRELGDV